MLNLEPNFKMMRQIVLVAILLMTTLSSVTAQDTTTAEITEIGGGIQDGTETK